MANYTILSKKDVDVLIAQYAVGDVLDFALIQGGASSSSYKVYTSTVVFVLTICDEKELSDVRNMVELLAILEQKDFPTTRVVHSKTQGPITRFHTRPVLLKDYIEGQVIDELDLNMLDQLGRTTARLHEIPAPECLPKAFPYGLVYFPEVTTTSLVPEYSAWLNEKLIYLSENISPELPKGLIHGDIFNDNILFFPPEGQSETGHHQLTAIIDFEEACDYYEVFDLGMVIVGTCANQGTISLSHARSFVNGYQSRRQLEAPEKDSLKLFTEYAAVATSFWRFRQHHILKPDKARANDYVEMKRLADHIHSIPQEQFREGIN
jgi:homoserine kinase type II